MNNFTKGILVGVGIGLLFAPVKGEEARRALSARLAELRNSLPENAQLNLYVRQVSDRVSQTSENLRDYAQQAVSKVKEAGNSLGDLAQQSVGEVKQTGKDVVDKTKKISSSTTKVIAEDSRNGFQD